MGASLPGARVDFRDDGLAGQRRRGDAFAGELLERGLLRRRGGGVDARVIRRAMLRGEFLVVNAGVLAGDGGNLGGQQAENDAVLVGGPCAAVAAQEGCAGAFLAAEAEAAIEQSAGEPLEADRHFQELAAETIDHAVDQCRSTPASCRLRQRRPLRPVGQQVVDGHRQEVVRVQQAARRRDDAVPVNIGVVAPGDVENDPSV